MNKALYSGSEQFNNLSPSSYTMFMTLAARASAQMSAPETGFIDPYAKELCKRLQLDLSAYTGDPLLVRSVVLRAALFDALALQFIDEHPGTIGIGLGCGLCSRGQRLRDRSGENAGFTWYDLDLPGVIAIRNQYSDIFPQGNTIGCSITDLTWLDTLDRKTAQPLLLVMEGVAPYLSLTELESLFRSLGERMGAIAAPTELIFDFVHPSLTGKNQPFPLVGTGEVVFHSGFIGGKAFARLHPSIRVKAEHHFIENISSLHAGFHREFLEKTKGEYPYTVAQVCFDHQSESNSEQVLEVSVCPEKETLYTGSKKINWNPCYSPVKLSPTAMVLLGETGSFLLEGGKYRELLVHVDGTKTKEEILLLCKHFSEQAYLLYMIDTLMDNGFISETDNSKSSYVVPDFYREPVEYTSLSGNNRLIFLSQYQNQKLFIRWFEGLVCHMPISIVISDDYLDPRLEQIHIRQAREKRPWILLKPAGRQPFVGPYFIPGSSRLPCVECLAVRLFHNQPVRRWLHNGDRNNIAPIPVLYNENNIKRFLVCAKEKIEYMIKGDNTGILWSIDIQDFSMLPHSITRRPQCRVCGSPDYMHQQSQKPLKLSPAVKVPAHDGGSRTLLPVQTVRNVLPLVSPVTGIIHELKEVPGRAHNSISIYRTSFYKTPFGSTTPLNRDFVQISLGKGISEEQSKASALCESVERCAVQYQGDELCVLDKACDLDKQSIGPDQLIFLSREQYARLKDPVDANMYSNTLIKEYDPGDKIHWTLCWSLTKEELCYIPFTYCYSNTPYDAEARAGFNSNGCAAGNTLEEAILQGFFELIERDAVAVWWYNKLIRSAVDINGLDKTDSDVIQQTLIDKWEYWILDLTHDFRIPVMAGVGRSKKTGELRLGFGCHMNAYIACKRALTELCQLIAIDNKGTDVFDFTKITPEPYLFPGTGMAATPLASFPESEQEDILTDIQFCVRRADELGYEVLVHNSSRPDFPVFTVKVIIPGLCHIWPQLGNPRLYHVPVKMNWLDKELPENQLNGMGLFI